MKDNVTVVSDLKRESWKFVDDRDWNKYHNPKDLAISIAKPCMDDMFNNLYEW